MPNLTKLPTWADKTHIHAVVETPRGSHCKLEFDPKLRVFTLAKPLLAGLTYPYDWGFIPSTEAEDGDPLDVLVIHDAGTYPGLVLRCKPIGVLEVLQTSKSGKERNDRIFAVPDRSPFEGDLQDVRRLPPRAVAELEKFSKLPTPLKTRNLNFSGGAARRTRSRPSNDFRVNRAVPCPHRPILPVLQWNFPTAKHIVELARLRKYFSLTTRGAGRHK